MELLLAMPVGHTPPPARFGLLTAHMAYRIGSGPVLLGIRLPEELQGGLMLVDCEGFDGLGDPLPCCSQILGECRRRNYSGIVCDFDGEPTACLKQMTETLDHQCAKEGWTLYVTEQLAAHAPAARVLIPSAVTNGSLERRLRVAMERYGASRPVLAVEWLRKDLPLPNDRRGDPMTQLELEDQIRRLQPATFFDRGLCANYYTYMANGGQAHFVLFDTPQSLRAKISLCNRLGLPAVLMAAPEVMGHLPAILDT